MGSKAQLGGERRRSLLERGGGGGGGGNKKSCPTSVLTEKKRKNDGTRPSKLVRITRLGISFFLFQRILIAGYFVLSPSLRPSVAALCPFFPKHASIPSNKRVGTIIIFVSSFPPTISPNQEDEKDKEWNWHFARAPVNFPPDKKRSTTRGKPP